MTVSFQNRPTRWQWSFGRTYLFVHRQMDRWNFGVFPPRSGLPGVNICLGPLELLVYKESRKQ